MLSISVSISLYLSADPSTHLMDYYCHPPKVLNIIAIIHVIWQCCLKILSCHKLKTDDRQTQSQHNAVNLHCQKKSPYIYGKSSGSNLAGTKFMVPFIYGNNYDGRSNGCTEISVL